MAAPQMTQKIRQDAQQIAQDTVKKLDKNRYILRKRTGWLLATLIVMLLIGAATLGSQFYTQAHKVKRLQQHVQKLQYKMDTLEKHQQKLERLIITIQTDLEWSAR